MFRFAFANLLSRPGRTILAMLGLTIAIAGMVGLFAIAGGIDRMLEEGLGDIPGVVVMQPGAPIPLFSSLPAEWGDEMARIEGVRVVNPEVWTRVNTLDGKTVFSPPRLLLGIDIPTRLQLKHGVYPERIEAGRFLDEDDIGRSRIVISRQIAGDLQKTVGDSIELNGREMTVVGIYHTGSLIIDVTIIAEISVVRSMARMDARTVSCLYLEPREGVSADILVKRVQEQFADREPPVWKPSAFSEIASHPPQTLNEWLMTLSNAIRRLFSTERETNESAQSWERSLSNERSDSTSVSPDAMTPGHLPLEVQSVADFGDRFDDLSTDLDLVLALLTGLGLLIAVFSILNTMLMSVSERTVEFGILRANGWSRGDVVRLISCESAILGLAGGVLGVQLGWISTQVINSVWSDRILLYAGPLLLSGSLFFSIAIGMLGGLYPAIRAARMSPMQAIRRG